MASEMTIAVTKSMKKDEHRVYQYYDAVIETGYRAELDEDWKNRKEKKVWKLDGEVSRKSLYVGREDREFDEIWDLKPTDETVLISAEHLKHAMVAYRERELEQAVPRIYQTMVNESIENQIVSPGGTDLAGRITVDTLLGRVHLWGSMAESMCFDRKGIEVWEACNHEMSNLVDQLYLMGLFHVRHNPYYYVPWEEFIFIEKSKNIDDEKVTSIVGQYDKNRKLQDVYEKYKLTPRFKQTSEKMFGLKASWDVENAHNTHLTRFWDQPKVHLVKKEVCDQLVDALRKVADDLKVNFEMSDTPGICERFSRILSETFQLDIYAGSAYKQIHRRKKFAANLVRAADQMCGTKLNPNTREKCLQGVYQVASALLGPIYTKMKSEMGYDVNSMLKSYNEGKNKEKLFRILKNNQKMTLLQRKNVYVDFPMGRHQGLTWINTYQHKSVKINMEEGVPYTYCDEEDENLMCTSFNDEYYYLYMDALLEREEWDDQIDDVGSLLNEEGNILHYDIASDFYITESGELHLADYYRKRIIFNLVRGHEFECIDTYSEGYNIAHKGSKRLDNDQIFFGIDGLFKMGMCRFDSTSLGEGKTLARPKFEDIAGGIMAQCAEYMSGKDWFISRFCKRMECREKSEELAWCNSFTTPRFMIWEYAIFLYTIFKNYAPVIVRKMRTRKFESVYPDIDTEEIPEIIFEIRHISQIPIMLIDVLCENRERLRNEHECVRILLEIQSVKMERRHLILKKVFPSLVNYLREPTPSGMLMINFLPLLLTFGLAVTSKCSKRVVPITYCDEAKMRILPITITDYEGSGNFLNWVVYLTKFYGIKQHETMTVSDELKMIHPWIINYYLRVDFLDKPENVIELSTKRQLVEMWLGQRCGGVSEGLIFIRSSHFPSRGFVAISINDGLVPTNLRFKRVRERFSGSEDTMVGVVCVEVLDDAVRVFAEGKVEARILKRIFWGVQHDVIIIKSKGRVFGNELMVTKLMNI
ncbi:outer capsid [Wallal virus]|uniref:Outer capsid protein VP2 n=1 Tax=Wallal virus TaxID=40061 RepID=U3RCS2_9REOV|nr:outer capsid [Wallal virus]AGX00988.1 outer capsid [Wallal virus]